MKFLSLWAKRYLSLRDAYIKIDNLNVFIGANAPGKSTILDQLRFMHEAVLTGDFGVPVFARGGMQNSHALERESYFT